MESQKILHMVSSDVDVLVVHGDEGSHEEASERVSTVPGRDRAGNFQETLDTKARESILEEDLAKNVSLSLHNSFCLNRESKVKVLPSQAKRLQEQREWMQFYEQLKSWEEIVISSDDEEELSRQITMSSVSGLSTSRARGKD